MLSYSLLAIMMNLTGALVPDLVNTFNQLNWPVMITCVFASLLLIFAFIPLQ